MQIGHHYRCKVYGEPSNCLIFGYPDENGDAAMKEISLCDRLPGLYVEIVLCMNDPKIFGISIVLI